MRKGDTDVSNRPKCSNFAPATFGGHWRDWHRGHGCNLDPTPQSQPVVSPPPTPDVERLTCEWRETPTGLYVDCGCVPNEFAETLSFREWTHCPYCGKSLKLVGDTPTPGGA